MAINNKKIGKRIRTDSLTPRRFKKIKPKMSRTSVKILSGWNAIGRKLKSASALLAIDIVIVNI